MGVSADTTLLSHKGLVETSVGAAGAVWRDADLGLQFTEVGMVKE